MFVYRIPVYLIPNVYRIYKKEHLKKNYLGRVI